MGQKVTIKLFASFREAVGEGQLEWPLPDNENITAGAVLETLVQEYPALTGPARACRIMVNRKYAGSTTELTEGDEVAFIPPVGGG
jgi:MoaD family protein